jgi:hypothetical protein
MAFASGMAFLVVLGLFFRTVQGMGYTKTRVRVSKMSAWCMPLECGRVRCG